MRPDKWIVLAALVILTSASAHADNASSRYGVTLGSPWLGIKYNLSSSFGAEFRATFDPEVKVTYLRGNYLFPKQNRFQLFAGLEYGFIRFDTSDIDGRGSIITPFFGSEYSISNKIALAADLGYSVISLKSDEASLSGGEYIFNLWLVLYPFR